MSSNKKENKNGSKKSARILAGFLAVAMLFGSLVTVFQAFFAGKNNGSSTASNFNYSEGLDKNGFMKDGDKTIKALDIVTLPDYNSYEISDDLKSATDEELQTQLDTIKKNYTTTTNNSDSDRTVQEGDVVNLDYIAKVDGTEFEGGTTGGKGKNIVVGSDDAIRAANGDYQGFEEQLIGHKMGEKFDVTVKMPSDKARSKDGNGNEVVLADKEVVYSVTLNYAQDKHVPELNDDFVKENLSKYYDSYEDMIREIKDNIVLSKKLSYIWNKLGDESQFGEIPAAVTRLQKNYATQSITATASQYGIDPATYASLTGAESLDALVEKSAETASKGAVLCQALCENEGIEVTDEDVSSFFYKNFGIDNLSTYKSTYGEPYLKYTAMQNVVLTKILENIENK